MDSREYFQKKIDHYKLYLFWVPILTFVVYTLLFLENILFLRKTGYSKSYVPLYLCGFFCFLAFAVYVIVFKITKGNFKHMLCCNVIYALNIAIYITDALKFNIYPLGQSRLIIGILSLQFAMFALANCLTKEIFLPLHFLFCASLIPFYFIIRGPNIDNSSLFSFLVFNVPMCFGYTTICLINDKQTGVNIKNQELVRNLSFVDTMTKCYRREFINEIPKEYFNSCSIVMMDLDHFKSINDTMGHDVGDELLVNFTTILLEKIHLDKDYVIRWGGDEFVLLCKDMTKERTMEFLQELKQSCYMKEHKVKVSFTAGVSNYDSSISFEDNIKRVDKLLIYLKNEDMRGTISAI